MFLIDGNVHDRVPLLLEEAAALDILPRFGTLAPGDIWEKVSGELVTAADLAAERRLSEGLADLIPGALVVGEELLLTEIPLSSISDDVVWVVDPLDGTTNFIRGKPAFAIMIGLLHRRRTIAAWIYAPLAGWLAVAEQGEGTYLNGVQLQIPPPPPVSEMSGAIHTRYLPAHLVSTVRAAKQSFAKLSTTGCAGIEYVSIARGDKHFALYYRTLPWDHAPGGLIVDQAGGKLARFDGTPYKPLALEEGLLVATDHESWLTIHHTLFPGIPTALPFG